jgi:uncharacterized damage-inducible protein DinB
MNPEVLLKLYGYTHYVIIQNLNDVSNEEGLQQPAVNGNCINWVLGHIVVQRNRILDLVGEAPVIGEKDATTYERGSESLTDASQAKPLALDQLLSQFNTSQERLTARLNTIHKDALEKPRDDTTVGDALAVLQFHEAYHAGQLGILRRLLGKEGAIK